MAMAVAVGRRRRREGEGEGRAADLRRFFGETGVAEKLSILTL